MHGMSSHPPLPPVVFPLSRPPRSCHSLSFDAVVSVLTGLTGLYGLGLTYGGANSTGPAAATAVLRSVPPLSRSIAGSRGRSARLACVARVPARWPWRRSSVHRPSLALLPRCL